MPPLQSEDSVKEDSDEDNNDKIAEVQKRSFDMILNIVDRSVYFLSTNDVTAQVDSM